MNTTQALTVVPCTGIPITACKRQQAARAIVELATSDLDTGVDVHLCNAYTLALADKDPEFHALLEKAGINFPDGMSVVWANRWRHRELDLPKERVYGPDLFLDVFDLGQEVGLRHFLLGSTPQVLSDLVTELKRRFPRAQIVGTDSPPFRPLTHMERTEQSQRVKASQAQLIWVGLGTPKQDYEAAELARLGPGTLVAVGAAFDFVAGNKVQAPRWVQERGLEWAFRLACEPGRLWKRYLLGNTRFVSAVLRAGR